MAWRGDNGFVHMTRSARATTWETPAASSPAGPHVTEATHMAPTAGAFAGEDIRAAGLARMNSRMSRIAATGLHHSRA